MTTNLKIITLLDKCDKTMGLIQKIIVLMNAADDSSLKNLSSELHEQMVVDGTLAQAQAEIRDMIVDLR
jgi:hypothetical protein